MDDLNKDLESETPQEEPKETVLDLWNKTDFEGKELFELKANYDLLLKAFENRPERKIASLNKEEFHTTIEKLQNQFEENKTNFEELKKQWQEHEVKTDLLSSVHRFKETFNRSNAIGSYPLIWNELDNMEKELDHLLKENYNTRLAIIEKAEAQKDNADATKEEWDGLLEEWKAAPYVEKQQLDELWERFETAKNIYHTHKQEAQKDREKEQMQNLDFKLEICEEAEKWKDSEDWYEASEVFRKLFDRWKEIGHVTSIEKNNELWERFDAAKENFYSRKAVHFEKIRAEQEANYEQKMKLVEEAENIKESTDWKETANAYQEIMEKWKSIGKVPYEKSDEIWNKLLTAKDYFFTARKANFEKRNEEREKNLELKRELIQKAEALKNSTDWGNATKEINGLMDEWKKIGPVPRAFNQEVWEQFLSARKHFFNRKDADRDRRKNTYFKKLYGRVEQTQQFLNKLRAEQEEDMVSLEDFKKSLADTTGTSIKDDELRGHLKALIEEVEKRLPKRSAKIEEVANQLTSLTESIEKTETEKEKKKTETKKVENTETKPSTNDSANNNPEEDTLSQKEEPSSDSKENEKPE